MIVYSHTHTHICIWINTGNTGATHASTPPWRFSHPVTDIAATQASEKNTHACQGTTRTRATMCVYKSTRHVPWDLTKTKPNTNMKLKSEAQKSAAQGHVSPHLGKQSFLGVVTPWLAPDLRCKLKFSACPMP